MKDTELLFILKSEIQFDEEGMIETRHYVPLPLHILGLVLFHDVAFFQDFNCNKASECYSSILTQTS